MTIPPLGEGVETMAKFEVGKTYMSNASGKTWECTKRTNKCVWMRVLEGTELTKVLSSNNSFGWWHIKVDADGNEYVGFSNGKVVFKA